MIDKNVMMIVGGILALIIVALVVILVKKGKKREKFDTPFSAQFVLVARLGQGAVPVRLSDPFTLTLAPSTFSIGNEKYTVTLVPGATMGVKMVTSSGITYTGTYMGSMLILSSTTPNTPKNWALINYKAWKATSGELMQTFKNIKLL